MKQPLKKCGGYVSFLRFLRSKIKQTRLVDRATPLITEKAMYKGEGVCKREVSDQKIAPTTVTKQTIQKKWLFCLA